MNRITPDRITVLLSTIFGEIKTREFTSGSLLKRARTSAPQILAAIEAIQGKRRLHAIRLGRLLEELREQETHGEWRLCGVRDNHKNRWTYHVEPSDSSVPFERFTGAMHAARMQKFEEEARIENEMEECTSLTEEAKVLDRELRRVDREKRREAREEIRAEMASVAHDTRERRRQEAHAARLEQEAELAATPVTVWLCQRWATREQAEEAGHRLGPEARVEITRDHGGGGSQTRWGIRLELDRATAARRHAQLARVASHLGWKLEPLADPAPPIDPTSFDVLPPGTFPNARIGEAVDLQQAPTPHESI
ncbi:MAG TPA: hypothetical protein VFX20_19945 [Steroidobacteraceae bacterium]|nr:hypothetical protein [Steroidobacteraceae bacterium]